MRTTLLLLALTSACTDDTDPSAASKEVVQQYHEDVWVQGRLDHAGNYLGPGFTSHAVVTTLPAGAQIDQNFLGQFWVGFPDLHSQAQALIADGDLVTIRWTITGTHTGTFLGVPPTNRPITVDGMDILRVEDGKIVEQWGGVADQMDDFLAQIGAH